MVTGIASAAGVRRPVQTQTVSSGKPADFSEALRKASAAQTAQGTSLNDLFQAAAEKYNVPVNLLEAVAKAESGFRADAVSSCGAQGIMQLMPSTAKALGVTDSFDPAQNIMGGAKYLGELLNSFGGDASLAVAGYNAGGGAVRKYGGIPPYAETQNYVKKVLGYAGMDLSVPEAAYSSGASSSAAAVVPGAAESLAGTQEPLLSGDEFLLFAQMFAQRAEQNALDLVLESAGKSETGTR